MKKVLILSLFSVGFLVSLANAAQMCLYSSGDCWPAGSTGCDGGWVYEGGKEGKGTLCEGGTFVKNGTNQTGNPPTSAGTMLGCCDWDGKGKCFGVYSQAESTDCQTGTNVWYAGSDACPNDEAGTCKGNGNPGGGDPPPSSSACQKDGQNLFCDWGNKCYSIDSKYSDVDKADAGKGIVACVAGSCTCENLILNCTSFGTMYANSTVSDGSRACNGTVVGGTDPNAVLGYCRWGGLTSDCGPVTTEQEKTDCGANLFNSIEACRSGDTPILKSPASMALIVAPFGRSLHISSAKGATVSLYDMSGAKVYSGKVPEGNRVFGLEKVSSGSYYAIVQSGSNSKKIPVILK